MKTYNKLILLFISLLLIPNIALAHDGGHGPKITDVGLFGGLMTAVVKESERSKGDQAELIYKAELVRSQSGKIRVYLYNKELKPIKIDTFAPEAKAVLISLNEGKDIEEAFSLKKEKRNYAGQAPKEKSKPFNIDIVFEEKGVKYLAAFDNLD